MIPATLRRLRRWLTGRPVAPAEQAAISSTPDPVLQLLAVAEEAVAAFEHCDTQEARGWAEAAVATLDELAGEDLFSSEANKDPGAGRDFFLIMTGNPEGLVDALIEQHQLAGPELGELIRAAGSGIVALGAQKQAKVAGRRAVAEAVHEFRAATTAHLVEVDPAAAILAERTPRLRERIKQVKGARCLP